MWTNNETYLNASNSQSDVCDIVTVVYAQLAQFGDTTALVGSQYGTLVSDSGVTT